MAERRKLCAMEDEALCALAASGDRQAEESLVVRYNGRRGQRGSDPGGDAGAAQRHPGV